MCRNFSSLDTSGKKIITPKVNKSLIIKKCLIIFITALRKRCPFNLSHALPLLDNSLHHPHLPAGLSVQAVRPNCSDPSRIRGPQQTHLPNQAICHMKLYCYLHSHLCIAPVKEGRDFHTQVTVRSPVLVYHMRGEVISVQQENSKENLGETKELLVFLCHNQEVQCGSFHPFKFKCRIKLSILNSSV